MDDEEVTAFGRQFSAFLEHVVGRARRSDTLRQALGAHLGADPLTVPIVSAAFAPFEHPDVQRAVDGHVATTRQSREPFGLSGGGRRHMDLSEMLGSGYFEIGPVVWTEMPVDVDATMACAETSVHLVAADDGPAYVLVLRLQDRGMGVDVIVDVMSDDAGHSRAVLDGIRSRMRHDSVYRGKVFALARSDGDYERGIGASFMRRPTIDRDDIVLPDGVLERIERRTLEFDAHAREMVARGQARKRGLLLYGPPGTGKTMTARYLVGSLRQRTTIVLTGIALGSIGAAANLARRLQPALLVLEDVDLVAAGRTFDHDNPLLFELLNQLDGLGDDADVLALLTTNRVDVLEPALAARPGRVDLAVELPLPDHVGFRRLLDRYTAHVAIEIEDWSRVIPRLVGTPAAFVRELVRTAVLGATIDGAPAVTATHFDDALTELLDSGPVTPRLHGGAPGEGYA